MYNMFSSYSISRTRRTVIYWGLEKYAFRYHITFINTFHWRFKNPNYPSPIISDICRRYFLFQKISNLHKPPLDVLGVGDEGAAVLIQNDRGAVPGDGVGHGGLGGGLGLGPVAGDVEHHHQVHQHAALQRSYSILTLCVNIEWIRKGASTFIYFMEYYRISVKYWSDFPLIFDGSYTTLLCFYINPLARL